MFGKRPKSSSTNLNCFRNQSQRRRGDQYSIVSGKSELELEPLLQFSMTSTTTFIFAERRVWLLPRYIWRDIVPTLDANCFGFWKISLFLKLFSLSRLDIFLFMLNFMFINLFNFSTNFRRSFLVLSHLFSAGTTSLMTTPDHVRTAGVKMGC